MKNQFNKSNGFFEYYDFSWIRDGTWGPSAHCGLFGIVEDHFENYQSLDEKFVKNRTSTFFFEAKGNSMEPIIFEHDILIVDKSLNVSSNQIVVASINRGFVCKYYIEKKRKVILRSENPRVRDVYVTEQMDMHIFGVVVGVYKTIPGGYH